MLVQTGALVGQSNASKTDGQVDLILLADDYFDSKTARLAAVFPVVPVMPRNFATRPRRFEVPKDPIAEPLHCGYFVHLCLDEDLKGFRVLERH